MRTAILTFIGLGALVLSSCGQYIYKSVTPHTNLFTKQHDINIQGNLGGSGGDLYVAYAPTNFLAFGAGYSGYSNLDSLQQRKGRFTDLEFSVTPFYAKNEYVFEMPLGIGLTTSTVENPVPITISPYTRSFAQPTVGFKWDNVEMAIFYRLSMLSYTDSRYGTDIRHEPGFMFRGGSKVVKGMIQIRADFGTNYSKRPETTLTYYQQAEYLPFHISMGISIGFNALTVGKKPAVKK